MWLAALYYLQYVLPERWWIFCIAISFVGLSIWQGAFQFRKKDFVRQSIMMALFIFSFTVALLSLVRPQYLESAFNTKSKAQSVVKWTPFSLQELENAKAAKQPVIVDFFADWCAACHELEEKTYMNPEFVQLTAGFKLLKVDATEDTAEVQAILQKYQVQGLPTVVFINRNGDLLKGLTFTQFITWDQLKPKMLESSK